MTVYVDDMKAPFRGMIMCHMVADTEEELIAFATKQLGLKKEWHQHAGTWRSHFDIALSKRKLAVSLGAVEITTRQLVLQQKAKYNEDTSKLQQRG